MKYSEDQNIEKGSVCGESTHEFMSDFMFAFFGSFFLIVVLINIHIFLYCSESIRLNGRKRAIRRNLHPELGSV